MIDDSSLTSFGDELEKIAIFSTVGKWLARGWNHPTGNLAEHAAFMGKGRFTKYLPIGDKSIATAFVGASLPGALKKEDPHGLDRSRAERLSGLAGSTLGGFMGTGALASLPMKRFKLLRAIAGGLGGSMLGERAATAPFRAARMKAEMPVVSDEQRYALMNQAGGAQ